MGRTSDAKERLIEAVIELIWTGSYGSTSVDQICDRAGVKKGSFYHFFPTKNDLAAAALEDHWESVRPELDAIFASDKKPQLQLRALCQEILKKQKNALESTGKVCGCPYATVGAEISGSNEALRALSEQMSERFSDYFEQLLKNAVRAKLIPAKGIKARAREMHIYVIGAMLQARISNTLDSVGASLETALMRISGLDTPSPARK